MNLTLIGLALIVRGGKVLIGERSQANNQIKNLDWVFPGGKLESLKIRQEVKREVEEETGLKVRVDQLVDLRIHPASGKNHKIIAFYFACYPERGDHIKPGKELKRLKWVNFKDLSSHFHYNTSKRVSKFLAKI